MIVKTCDLPVTREKTVAETSFLLKKNIDLLKDSNIYYEVLPRTSKARQMKMTYLGDEAL